MLIPAWRNPGKIPSLQLTSILSKFLFLLGEIHLFPINIETDLTLPMNGPSLEEVQENESSLCLVDQLCPTLCDLMDCSPPGSSVHGILQVRVPVWLLCPPPGHLPDPGMEPWSLMSPALAGGFFITSAIWKAWPVPETAPKWDDRFFIRDFKKRELKPLKSLMSPSSLNSVFTNIFLALCMGSIVISPYPSQLNTQLTSSGADGPFKVEDSPRVTFSITRSSSEQTMSFTSI